MVKLISGPQDYALSLQVSKEELLGLMTEGGSFISVDSKPPSYLWLLQGHWILVIEDQEEEQ